MTTALPRVNGSRSEPVKVSTDYHTAWHHHVNSASDRIATRSRTDAGVTPPQKRHGLPGPPTELTHTAEMSSRAGNNEGLSPA
jgi:hypothetical protein